MKTELDSIISEKIDNITLEATNNAINMEACFIAHSLLENVLHYALRDAWTATNNANDEFISEL